MDTGAFATSVQAVTRRSLCKQVRLTSLKHEGVPVWFGRVATFLSVMVVVIDLFIPKNLFPACSAFPAAHRCIARRRASSRMNGAFKSVLIEVSALKAAIFVAACINVLAGPVFREPKCALAITVRAHFPS